MSPRACASASLCVETPRSPGRQLGQALQTPAILSAQGHHGLRPPPADARGEGGDPGLGSPGNDPTSEPLTAPEPLWEADVDPNHVAERVQEGASNSNSTASSVSEGETEAGDQAQDCSEALLGPCVRVCVCDYLLTLSLCYGSFSW